MDKLLQLLVLNSGESVLGEVVKENQTTRTVTLKNVVYIIIDPQRGAVSALPYLNFSEESKCDFKDEHIRHYLTPKQSLVEGTGYNQIFSKIQTPNKSIILG